MEYTNGKSPFGKLSVFLEKFGGTYNDYMHGANFVIQDMMMADAPRMLSKEEKEKLKKKKQTVKVKSANEMKAQMKNLFG